jgi:D-glycero-alpha-D-manno-heptose-7-phosphate kinase
MIISRTPYRISFFGGGTDYPGWFREHGGSVLGTTINRYCYINCRYLPPFFEHRFRLVYSKTELCQTVDDIVHPAVRECLRLLHVKRGLEVHHDGDLPARSGMGSSSSFTVGLLHALHGLKGEMVSKQQLAEEGTRIEQEILKENVGCQDQVMAAHGGFNHIEFLPNGEIIVRPVTLTGEYMQELNDHLMLFYTGVKRTASVVAASYVNSIKDHRRDLRIMQDLVKEGLSVLGGSKDLRLFADLLHESWIAKRRLSDMVSNTIVDQIYEEALAGGALGGKLLGAGGGGFLLLFVPPACQENVRQRLGQLIRVPFKFEFNGSQIIFLDREGSYAELEQDRAERSIGAFQELGDSAK